MRRTSIMTLGFVLIFIGIQLHFVQSYVLTQRVSDFLSEKSGPVQAQPSYGFPPANSSANTAFNSPYYQASYGAGNSQAPLVVPPAYGNTSVDSRAVTPPRWLCWPILFLGTVVFLHGFSMRRNY